MRNTWSSDGGTIETSAARGLDHLRVVRGDRRVPEPVDLLVHGGDHGRVAMAEVGHPDAAPEIEHVAPVDGVQMRALGTLDNEVRVAVIRRRDQLGVAFTPCRRIRGREHAAHDPDVAVAGPDEAGLRTPTLPRARKPPNMIAMPAAS